MLSPVPGIQRWLTQQLAEEDNPSKAAARSLNLMRLGAACFENALLHVRAGMPVTALPTTISTSPRSTSVEMKQEAWYWPPAKGRPLCAIGLCFDQPEQVQIQARNT